MLLPLHLTIPQMLTHTYLEVPILDKYRIENINDSTFGKGSLAIIEKGKSLFATEIVEDRSAKYEYQTTTTGQTITVPVGVNFGYTIFVNGMYHKYPESVDRLEPHEFTLADYVPLLRITEYFLKLI